jgi:FkbM family methyltransferase
MLLPELTLRTFSNDFLVLDQILHNNFYQLNKFDKDDIVVDLGSNIGIFTFTCFGAGVGKVYSFEPYPENYRLLLKNTDVLRSTDKIVTYNFGVSIYNCNMKFIHPTPENKFYNFSEISTNNIPDKKYILCPCFSLNSILTSYVEEDKIELLKINVGSREMDILLSSNILPLKVQNICGVTISTDGEIIKFQDKMKEIGYKDSFVKKLNKESDYYIFFFSKSSLKDRFSID